MHTLSLFKKKQRLIFIFAPRYEHSGSTIMRGKQLSSIFKAYFGLEYSVSYRPLSANFKNSIIFLTKGAVTDITIEQIDNLRARGNRVLLDFVDNPLNLDKARAADAVVAASLEAHDDYQSRGLRSFSVNHHIDTRLPRNTPNQAPDFRCGYFGELINTIRSEEISKYVDFVQVDTGQQTAEWLTKPIHYSLHYGIRSYNVEAFKPFLKGFTAAACGANLIIQRDQKEAVRWLGDDYPFLVKPQPTEEDILTMLKHAQAVYKSTEWNRALERMRIVQEATSDQAIATELHVAIQSL